VFVEGKAALSVFFGLPEDYLALLAPGRSAFIREGDRIVGHGGISLEEIAVPMVQIERLSE
jgi:hypothetical protein